MCGVQECLGFVGCFKGFLQRVGRESMALGVYGLGLWGLGLRVLKV